MINRTMKQVHRTLETLQPSIVLASGWLMIGLITWIDYMTRDAFDLSHLYLVPLYPITWFVGIVAGIISASVIAVAWGIVEWRVDVNILNGFTVAWNSAIDFGLYGLFCTGISSIKDLIQQLNDTADSDPLTGAANRRCFYKAAKNEISRNHRYGEQFSLVYFDVDNFKSINDLQGHNAGDKLLCQTVSILNAHSRDIDTVARLGGDEFAVLLPETGQNAARSYIAKLQPLFKALATDRGWSITFSIGVITYDAAPESIETLLAVADKMMYSVKRSGKDGVALSIYPA